MIRALLFCAAVLLLAGCGDVAPTVTPIPVPTATPIAAYSNDPTRLIGLAVTAKSFHKADFSKSGDKNEIDFSLVLTNNTGTNLRAFTGDIEFRDLFDRPIQAVTFTYDKILPTDASATWDGAVDFNPYLDPDVKLRDTELANLHAAFKLTQYIDVSGAKKTFSK